MEPVDSLFSGLQSHLKFFPHQGKLGDFCTEIAKLIHSKKVINSRFHKFNPDKIRDASCLVIPAFSGWLFASTSSKTYILAVFLIEKPPYTATQKSFKRCLYYEGKIDSNLSLDRFQHALYKKVTGYPVDHVEKALDFQMRLKDPHIAQILLKLDTRIKGQNHQLSWIEPHYATDLYKGIKTLGPLSRLTYLLHALSGLMTIHKQCYIHGDVKPSNIFIQYEISSNAMMADFDFAAPLFSWGRTDAYILWDSLSRYTGLRTFFTDIYGFVLTMGLVLLDPSFSNVLFSKNVRQEVQDCLLKIQCQSEIPGFFEKYSKLLNQLIEIDRRFREAAINKVDFMSNPQAAYEAIYKGEITLLDLKLFLESFQKPIFVEDYSPSPVPPLTR